MIFQQIQSLFSFTIGQTEKNSWKNSSNKLVKLSDEFVKSQHCLSSDHDEFLKMAFLEHVNRHVTKRLYPRSIGTKKEAINPKKEEPELSDNNAIMHQWFRGKCIMDESWCH